MDLFKCRSDPDSDSSLELDVHATLGVCIAAMNQEGEKGAPAIPGRKWRLLAKERDRTPVVEIENKGVFDELVVDQWLHIEQMSRSVPANQLWRNLLLAASLESSKAKAHRVQWAGVVVLSLAADHGAAKAIAEVEPLLVDGAKDRLRRGTLEDLVATAAGHEDLAAWADLFRRRYLADPKTL